jgi:hypothetical protein
MKLRMTALLTVSLLASAALPGGVKVGDLVQHQFREPLLNGGTLKSLGDLRGTPILIEYWGHN